MRLFRKRDPAPAEPIHANAEGVQLNDSVIRWEDIERITAYKRDCFTIDQVWFEIDTKDGKRFLNEDVPGFWSVVESMPSHLPTFKSDWWDAVIQPAFTENRTVIYERY